MAHEKSSPLRTLSIGGATYDLFLTMGKELTEKDHAICLETGSKLKVDQVIETCGGGACNTAVGLSRLGLNTSFCGIVGSDQWGEKLLETMKKEHVDVAPVTIVESETSSFSIVLRLASGERTILYSPGVNEHLHDSTFDLDAMSRVEAVYLNHLHETSCMIEDDIVTKVLKHPELLLAWNPGGCQIDAGMDAPQKKELLEATTLLLVNKEEALKFTKTESIGDALKKLIDAGVKNICITDGSRGVTASDGTHTYHCPVLKNVKVLDTTGAGDAFGTAALWAIATGRGLQIAMISGTLNAASVVGSIGAQAGLLTKTQIEKKLSENLLTAETVS